MASAKTSPVPAEKVEKADGRRQRSSRSREKIRTAFLELIQAGNYVPRALDISQRSGLSMRTVFRHIDDMEGIAREVNADVERRYLPILLKPYQSEDWRGRLFENLNNRVEIFEIIYPFRMHVVIRRHRSEFLESQYQRALDLEKAALHAILPDALINDETTFIALNQVMGIASWLSLRVDARCSVEKAKSVITRQIESLISEYD